MSVVQALSRERILRRQKRPSTFIVARYTDAFNSIRTALLAGEQVELRLASMMRLLAQRFAAEKHQVENIRLCIQAMRRFQKLCPELALAGTKATLTNSQGFAINIQGVAVTARPLVELSRVKRDGSTERGALLVVLRKEAALDERGGEATAEILRRSLVEAGHANVAPKLCIIVDVFGNKSFHAPLRNVRLTNEIECACREIAVLWPQLAA
jgi:hypothetical protein